VEINDSLKKAAGLSGAAATQIRPGKSAEKISVPKDSSDNVKISPELQALSGRVADSSVFDAKKVEQIKAAIAEGRFKVDPEKIANGLINTVKDLIHSRKA
jgi:negative regulator of flagellin synthesis FlgM